MPKGKKIVKKKEVEVVVSDSNEVLLTGSRDTTGDYTELNYEPFELKEEKK